MILAHNRIEEEEQDEKMQMLAWQTALLMNSTGNYKKKIKPKDLYTPMADAKVQEQQSKYNKQNASEVKKQLQEELLSAFADSDVVIK